MTEQKRSNLWAMVMEHSWRGRCLRTWAVLIYCTARALLDQDWTPWQFGLIPVIMVGLTEGLFWAQAHSKKYDMSQIAEQGGYRIGRVFRRWKG